MARRKGRGWLSSIELLPDEAGPVIVWAANQLRETDRTQQDIYEEFYTRLGELMADSHGELDFQIPSKSSFNRYSMHLASVARRLDETRRIAKAISEKFDASASDDLTLIAAEAIKTLIFELLSNAGEAGIDPKGAMQLAAALKNALQAQSVSTIRRKNVETAFEKDVKSAVGAIAKSNGLSAETAETIVDKILGVQSK